MENSYHKNQRGNILVLVLKSLKYFEKTLPPILKYHLIDYNQIVWFHKNWPILCTMVCPFPSICLYRNTLESIENRNCMNL